MAEGAEGVAPVLPKSITSLTSFDGDTTTRTTFYNLNDGLKLEVHRWIFSILGIRAHKRRTANNPGSGRRW